MKVYFKIVGRNKVFKLGVKLTKKLYNILRKERNLEKLNKAIEKATISEGFLMSKRLVSLVEKLIEEKRLKKDEKEFYSVFLNSVPIEAFITKKFFKWHSIFLFNYEGKEYTIEIVDWRPWFVDFKKMMQHNKETKSLLRLYPFFTEKSKGTLSSKDIVRLLLEFIYEKRERVDKKDIIKRLTRLD